MSVIYLRINQYSVSSSISTSITVLYDISLILVTMRKQQLCYILWVTNATTDNHPSFIPIMIF